MGAALFTFRTAPAAAAPSLAGIVLEYRMCCPGEIAVFKTDSACRLAFPDGHTAGIDNPSTIENIAAALSPTLPDGSIIEFLGGAFPVNRMGAMSYAEAGWAWFAGLQIVVPPRMSK